MNIRAFFIRTHIYLCLWGRCIMWTYMVWGWSRRSFIVVPTGADVAGTNSILSLSLFAASLCCSLSLSPSLSAFLSLSPFFCFDQMERCSSPNLSHSGSQCSKSCDPACYLLPLYSSFSCLCLSISARTPSFPVSFPPWQRQTKAFHFSLAC